MKQLVLAHPPRQTWINAVTRYTQRAEKGDRVTGIYKGNLVEFLVLKAGENSTVEAEILGFEGIAGEVYLDLCVGDICRISVASCCGFIGAVA